MTTIQNADKAYKKGLKELETSLFSLKFSPDYVSAVSYFEKAGVLYLEGKDYDKSILSFRKAIECNKKLVESWAEGQNYLRIAEIYIFNKNDYQNGMKYLKESQISFKLAGKYNNSLRIMIELCNKINEKSPENPQLVDFSIKVLEEAWEDACHFIHDKMIQIEIDNLYSRLLDCYLKNTAVYITKAIDLTMKYIKLLKNQKDTKPYIIVNALVRLLMLRFINKSISFDDIIEESNQIYESSIAGDIQDMKKFIESIKQRNQKNFGFCISYCYHLFEKELIKQVKINFDEHMKSSAIDEQEFLGEVDKNPKLNEAKPQMDIIYITDDDIKKDMEENNLKEEDFC